jgi:hypothetical protein
VISFTKRVTPAFDWLFRSRDNGRVAIAQWPNVSLWVVIGCDVAALLWHPAGTLGGVVHWSGRAALVWWSLDEIVRGVNPFRRLLGVVVLARVVIRIVAPGLAIG